MTITEKNIAWSVENPMSSLMWETTPFIKLRQWLQSKGKFSVISYQACMHGGRRPKKCSLW
eukprot:5850707-Karenia_brevis.AAC.1